MSNCASLFAEEVSIRPTRASALNNHQSSADQQAALATLASLTRRSKSRSMSVSSSTSSKRSASPEKVKGDKGKGKAKQDDRDSDDGDDDDGADVDEDQIENIYAKSVVVELDAEVCQRRLTNRQLIVCTQGSEE